MLFFKKNYKKLLGNLIAIVAIIFIIQRFKEFDIDYSSLLNLDSILYIIVFSFLYAVVVFIVGLPWKKLILLVTGVNIPFSEVCNVWTKSNILKYFPGNIWQYVGRNQIAVKHKLDHLLVVVCTILEVVLNLISAFALGAILYFPGFIIYWNNYFRDFIVTNRYIILIMIALAVFFCILVYKFSAKYKDTLKNILKVSNFKVYFQSIIFFCITSLFTGAIYLLVLTVMLEANFSINNLLIILGAFLLSWIVGFITPGAPGGIGVREAALSLALEPLFDMEAILLGIVIYRIINLIGDVIGVLYSKIYCTIVEKKQKSL